MSILTARSSGASIVNSYGVSDTIAPNEGSGPRNIVPWSIGSKPWPKSLSF
jgi:hypothetical protein